MQTHPTTVETVNNFQEQLRAIEIGAHQIGLTYNFLLMAAKRQFIIGALVRNKWNQCGAARDLGMHRNTVSRIIAELKITIPGRRTERNALRRRPQPALSLMSASIGWEHISSGRSNS